jgi:hypothetical protein
VAIWYSSWPFGIFNDHLVYFVAIWYILWPFGKFNGHLVYVSYGNLVYFFKKSAAKVLFRPCRDIQLRSENTYMC